MTVGVGSNVKQCVTCEYWQGPRKPDAFGRNAQYSGAAVGECAKHSRQQKAGASCHHWRKWALLK